MGRRQRGGRRQKGGFIKFSKIRNTLKSGFKKALSKKHLALKSAKAARAIAKSGILGSKAKKFVNSPLLDKAFEIANNQLGKGAYRGQMYVRGKRRRGQKGGILPLLAPALLSSIF